MARDTEVVGVVSEKAAGVRRARRRADSPVIPRDRILQAAARLFHEHGYKGTTVRDIAEAVGILSGSLFHHFHSKEEMVLEIMREAALGLCISAEEVAGLPIPPAERLQRMIDIELSWMVTDIKKSYLAVLVFEWREVPQSAKSEFTSLRKRYEGLWIDALEEYGKVVPLRVPPEAASRILHGALMGAMTWFRPSGRYSAQQYRDMLMKILRD